MVREKVKAKKARLSPDQCFSLEEDSKSDQELMELYEEQTKENTNENMESLETMLEAEDISDASAQLEEYSQRYHQDEEMAQCVPELVVYTPVELESKPKVTEAKHRPRMKFTPKRRSPEKAPRRKIKPSKNSASVTPQSPHVGSESEAHDEFPKAKKEGTWIQCSKIDCLKWRKLRNDIEPSMMPDRWVCAMNPDLSRTVCTASQETCDSELDFDVVYTPFVAGSLVWAKVPGYPWWPGMVEDDPDYNCCYETDDSNVNPISYHVSFIFDKDVSRSWVSYLGIRNFDGTENPNETGPKQKKYAKPLARALIQARNAIDLSLPERIKKYSFNVLYKGHIGSEMDEKPRKTKKRKQPKTSPELGNPKKTKAIKPEKKIKRPSLTDSEKSSENLQRVVKKKVKKRKRVFASSDEEDSGKEMATDAPTMNNDSSITLAENSDDKEDVVAKTEEIQHSPEIQPEGEDGNIKSVITKDEVSPQNSQIDKTDTGDDEKSERSKVKSTKKNKPAKTKNEVPKKKKRKSTISEEEEKPAQPKSPRKSTSPDHLKVKKKKSKKSEEKPTSKSEGRKSKKKSKFVNPVEAKSASVLNASNVSENSLDECGKDTSTFGERLLEELARDTSTDSSMGGLANDISNDSSMDDLTKDTSANEEISHTEETNATSDESKNQSPLKETANTNDSKESGDNKKPKPKKKKPAKVTKDSSATKDSTKTKVSAVKPKKFELTLAFGKKSKPTNEKKVKKIKKTSTPKTSGKENGGANQQESASPSEIVLEGSSVKPDNTKIRKIPGDEQKTKTTSRAKKVKQTFGKFKAPVKASSKVTPAAKVPRLKANKDEKSREEAKKTLEEVLDIPSSDDPRKNPENYVSIDSLEKDISNLYQELSENAAASTGVMNAEDIDDVTEASDCVTMEFLDEEISGNTGNSENLPARRLTDSPEF